MRVPHAAGLELEGIFRISANQMDLNKFKEQFDKSDGIFSPLYFWGPSVIADMTLLDSIGSEEILQGKSDDPHVATNLLKMFLRELPQPLLTEQLAERFFSVLGTSILSIWQDAPNLSL